MKKETILTQDLDTLTIALQARRRRDAYVGQALRGFFSTLFSRKPAAQQAQPEGWSNALAPLGSAAN